MAVAVLAERKRMLVGTPGSVGVIWVVAARGMPQLLVPHRKEQTALGRTVCLCAEVSARAISYPEWLGGKYACVGMLSIYFCLFNHMIVGMVARNCGVYFAFIHRQWHRHSLTIRSVCAHLF